MKNLFLEINKSLKYYRKCLIKDSIETYYGNLLVQAVKERVTGALGCWVLGQRKKLAFVVYALSHCFSPNSTRAIEFAHIHHNNC
jgi:hypothetical protein